MASVPVYIGLDYRSDSIQVCVMTADGRTLRNRRVPNEVGHVVECVTTAGGKDGVVLARGVALEACCGAAALAEATEWTVKPAHAGAVRRLKAGRDKTDHGDAWQLANLLRTNDLPEVWLADDATRRLRRLVRYRRGGAGPGEDEQAAEPQPVEARTGGRGLSGRGLDQDLARVAGVRALERPGPLGARPGTRVPRTARRGTGGDPRRVSGAPTRTKANGDCEGTTGAHA